MKNVAATNGQRVSLASFFLEEKACAGNLVVTGTLLNFCGVLLGRPSLSYERFRSKLATAEYRVHRAVQEKSERAEEKFFTILRAGRRRQRLRLRREPERAEEEKKCADLFCRKRPFLPLCCAWGPPRRRSEEALQSARRRLRPGRRPRASSKSLPEWTRRQAFPLP